MVLNPPLGALPEVFSRVTKLFAAWQWGTAELLALTHCGIVAKWPLETQAKMEGQCSCYNVGAVGFEMFVCTLFNDAFSVTQTTYTALNKRVMREQWMWKGVEESGRGLILRYRPIIYLERLRKTTKSLNIRSPGRDLNPGRPEYEGVSTTRGDEGVVRGLAGIHFADRRILTKLE
jgi:hypothetical protein